MKLIKIGIFALLVQAALIATASAETVATFADPSLDGSTPLFSLTSTNQFSGGWSSPGLTLLTPALPTPQYSDATFTLPAVAATPLAPGLWTLNGGTITFQSAAHVTVLIMAFGSASLDENVGVGASDLALQNVTFTAPGTGLIFAQKRFAFSFANAVQGPSSTTWTASMTSSANIVPEPASLVLAAAGMLMGVARRRR